MLRKRNFGKTKAKPKNKGNFCYFYFLKIFEILTIFKNPKRKWALNPICIVLIQPPTSKKAKIQQVFFFFFFKSENPTLPWLISSREGILRESKFIYTEFRLYDVYMTFIWRLYDPHPF